MCHGALRATEFEKAFGCPFEERFERALRDLEPLVADGLVERAAGGGLVVTSLGRLFVRNVAMVFDAYLAEQQRASKPMFSKTV